MDEVTVEEQTAFNPKAYQLVRRANGDYDFRRYNGAKAAQRYTLLGHFKFILMAYDTDKSRASRKLEAMQLGNKTLRRNNTDVATSAVDAVKALFGDYRFKPVEGITLNDAEAELVRQYETTLRKEYKRTLLETYVMILREASAIRMYMHNEELEIPDDLINVLADETYMLHNDVASYCLEHGSGQDLETRMKLMHPEVFHSE